MLSALLSTVVCARLEAADSAFALRNGDRVVFYGDSITQDGGYGRLVDQYVRTRFPQWDIRFYNAGVGGDTVRGGWAGVTSVRIPRDLLSLKPTVVTIMLGMNDGGYREMDQGRLDAFMTGYRAIVAQVRAALPDARIYLIRTSPFDDITRAPGIGAGYDAALRQLGDGVSTIGAEQHLQVVDFGGCVDDGLRAAWADNHDLARLALPDRVHPSPGGHLAMGACLLRAWNAPGLVARVEIDARAGTLTEADNASVSGLSSTSGSVQWKETDMALPLPIDFDNSDTYLADKLGADLESLDSEPLVVTGLGAGSYTLTIDDRKIGSFSAEALAAGINLALFNTPMRGQASQVHWASDDGAQIQRVRRQMLVDASKGEQGAAAAADILAAHDEATQAKMPTLAAPLPHAFSIVPAAN